MNGPQSSHFTDVLVAMYVERDRQLAKHGDQSHLPDGTSPEANALAEFWSYSTNAEAMEQAKARCKAASQNEGGDGTITKEHILTEEFMEVLAADSPEELRKELVQLATVAAWWAACLPE